MPAPAGESRPGLRRFLIEVGYGFCIGAAALVPGISGGTVAYLCGIYPRLIAALAALDLSWCAALLRLDTARLVCRDGPLLVALAVGLSAALAALAGVVELHQWIRVWPRPFHGLFCGMILGTILLFLRDGGYRWRRDVPWLCAGGLAGFTLLAGLSAQLEPHAPELFVAGSAVLVSMLVPGVSGAYLLLLLGLYDPVLEAISGLYAAVLVPFAAGGAVGLLLGVRLLHYLLRRHRAALLAFINGLLLVSLQRIWPFSTLPAAAAAHPANGPWVAGAALLAGLAVTLLLHPGRQRAAAR